MPNHEPWQKVVRLPGAKLTIVPNAEPQIKGPDCHYCGHQAIYPVYGSGYKFCTFECMNEWGFEVE